MKVPNKFWFYHYSNKNVIYFAEGDEYEYVISGGDLECPTSRTPDEVESYFQVKYWVLTVPSNFKEFKVRGVLTDTIYSITKDANNLYVMTGGQITSPIFHRREEVLASLYGENPLWEIHTEEEVKESPLPDSFKFRHCSDCEHNGQIFLARRYRGHYLVTWVDSDTGEDREIEYALEVAEGYLEDGLWVIVETDIPKDEPLEEAFVEKTISINVNSVRAAAEFDVANNKHTIKKGLSLEEIEQEIIRYVREMYSSLMSGELEWESRVTGARSYIVHFQAEDENYGVISVEVDPSIGMPSFYASVEDFLNQN